MNNETKSKNLLGPMFQAWFKLSQNFIGTVRESSPSMASRPEAIEIAKLVRELITEGHSMESELRGLSSRVSTPAIQATIGISDDSENHPFPNRKMASRNNYVLARCQQRGVSGESISTALKYGEHEYWFHGAEIYYLGRKAILAALAQEPELQQQTNLLEGTAIVVEESTGRVITAFKENRGLRQIRRNYRGKSRLKRHRLRALIAA